MVYNIFNNYIEDSKDICKNCFAKIRERESYNQDALRESLRGTVSEDVEKTKMATTEYQTDYEPSQSREVHCANCGSDLGFIQRPVKMDRALELADNLADRINEFDELEVDNRLLRRKVRELKKEDGHQDNSVYSEAVFQSVAIDN